MVRKGAGDDALANDALLQCKGTPIVTAKLDMELATAVGFC